MTDKRFEGYQVMVRGKEKFVSDLTLEEAKLEICNTIDFLETFQEKIDELTQLIWKWRKGE